MTTRKTASSATGAKASVRDPSPSGYWRVSVLRATPEIYGEVFRPGRDYVVADAALGEIEAADAVATVEPYLPPA